MKRNSANTIYDNCILNLSNTYDLSSLTYFLSKKIIDPSYLHDFLKITKNADAWLLRTIMRPNFLFWHYFGATDVSIGQNHRIFFIILNIATMRGSIFTS